MTRPSLLLPFFLSILITAPSCTFRSTNHESEMAALSYAIRNDGNGNGKVNELECDSGDTLCDVEGEIHNRDTNVYSVYGNGRSIYRILWDDAHQGSGNFSGDIVTTVQSDDESLLYDLTGKIELKDIDDGFSDQIYIRAPESGSFKISLKTYFHTNEYNGSYRLMVEEVSSDFDPAENISEKLMEATLTEPITGAGFSRHFYTMELINGEKYRLAWNDSVGNSSRYSQDIQLKVLDLNDSSYSELTDNLDNEFVSLHTHDSKTGTYHLEISSNTHSTETSHGFAFQVYPADLSGQCDTTDFVCNVEGSLTPHEIDLYRIRGVSGSVYRILWDDAYQGSGSYSADIKVSVVDENGYSLFEMGQEVAFENKDTGFTSERYIAPPESNGIFEIHVTPYYPSEKYSGTYRLVVENVTSTLSVGPNSSIAFTENTCREPVMGAGKSKHFYRVNLSYGTKYEIAWDDSAVAAGGSYNQDIYLRLMDIDSTSATQLSIYGDDFPPFTHTGSSASGYHFLEVGAYGDLPETEPGYGVKIYNF